MTRIGLLKRRAIVLLFGVAKADVEAVLRLRLRGRR